jgi:hypothetical protein
MKKTTLLFLILISFPLYSQWIQQNSGTDKMLTDVYCVTEDLVFVVGASGTILKTTDGGENWVAKPSGTTQDLMKVQFISPTVGFAFGSFGTLLKTTNAGETWSAIDTGIANYYDFHGLSCVNENVFYIAGTDWFKKTTDGGATFQTINTPGVTVENVQFLNEQTGYASGYDKLIKTTDGGATWTTLIENQIASFYYLNENTGFVYTLSGEMYKSTASQTNPALSGWSPGQALDLFPLSEDVIWEVNGVFNLCGCPPSYCITKKDVAQAGQTPGLQNCDFGNGLDLLLKAIYFANDTKGYAVGHLSYSGNMGPAVSIGAIYKNATGTMLNVNELDKTEALKIYPNPSSGQITLSFAEMPTDSFSVSVADALGKTVYSKTHPAQGNLSIDLQSLPKGFYLLTVSNRNKVTTQKVVID